MPEPKETQPLKGIGESEGRMNIAAFPAQPQMPRYFAALLAAPVRAALTDDVLADVNTRMETISRLRLPSSTPVAELPKPEKRVAPTAKKKPSAHANLGGFIGHQIAARRQAKSHLLSDEFDPDNYDYMRNLPFGEDE